MRIDSMDMICSVPAMKTPKLWGTLHSFYAQGSVLGRTVANRDFLRAFLRKASAENWFDGFHFFLPGRDDIQRLKERLQREFPELDREERFSFYMVRELPEALASTEYHCFHLSDPFSLFTELIRVRNRYSKVIFPVTAPTHSLSYKEYGESFLQHMWPGISGRDTVIATSRCGEAVVSNFYAALRQQYGLAPDAFPSPALSVVPLGVIPEHFPTPDERGLAGDNDENLRCTARKSLEFRDDEVVFLTLARISYYSKMDLLPLLHAFKRAEAEGLEPTKYRFLLAGWENESDTAGSDIERFCAQLGIPLTVVRRPDDVMRKSLYAAADVFVSPVDNLQETFGLTMLEAAVSSLPVIASDFDGYKDLVRHEETGILIPTLGPDDTADTNTRSAVATAAEYHLRLAQQCVVNVKALGLALARLGLDASLRAGMGRAGRKMALSYTWENIITRYMALWDSLAEKPLLPGEEERLRQSVHPCEVNYGRIFADYYSSRIQDMACGDVKIQWSKRGEAVYRGRDFPVIYTLMENSFSLEAVKRLLFSLRKPLPLATGRETAAELTQEYGIPGDNDILLLWALKHDLLEFV